MLKANATEDQDPYDQDCEAYDNKTRKEHYVERLKKQNFEKILVDKEKKRLLDLKREIKQAPKKPKLLSLEVLVGWSSKVLMNRIVKL